MADLDTLEKTWRDAEDESIALQAEADKTREAYAERMPALRDKAAAAQKEYLDACAAHALVGREDAETVAANLGLTLPE